MNATNARRSFLRGRFNKPAAMRPLGALPVMDFEDACNGCGDCARACPEGIIIRDDEGFPVVDLLRGECTFCNACTEACEVGALVADQPWPWRASVSSDCLSISGTNCRSCQDHCDSGAIRFRLQPGGRAQPELSLEDCIGCGACAASCPINAIQFKQISQPAEAHPC